MKFRVSGIENKYKGSTRQAKPAKSDIQYIKMDFYNQKNITISIVNKNYFMPWEEFVDRVQALCKEGECRTISITLEGDETLEHPCFLEMIRKIESLDMIANIKTNAVHIDYSLIQELEKVSRLGFVLISVDNAKELPLKKMKMLKEANIKVEVQYKMERLVYAI